MHCLSPCRGDSRSLPITLSRIVLLASMLSLAAATLLGCSSESGEPVASKTQAQVGGVQTLEELGISLPLDLSPYEVGGEFFGSAFLIDITGTRNRLLPIR